MPQRSRDPGFEGELTRASPVSPHCARCRAQPARQQAGCAQEHAQEEARVHSGDEPIVPPQVKVGHTILGVRHGSRLVDDRNAAPVEPNQHFDVELHSISGRRFIEQRDGRCERIDPESAHRVANAERQRVDPHPHVRGVASNQSAQRYRVIVDGNAANDRFWLLARQGKERGNLRTRRAVRQRRSAVHACIHAAGLRAIPPLPRRPCHGCRAGEAGSCQAASARHRAAARSPHRCRRRRRRSSDQERAPARTSSVLLHRGCTRA